MYVHEYIYMYMYIYMYIYIYVHECIIEINEKTPDEGSS